MARKNPARIKYRATTDFEESLGPLWQDFQKVPQLKHLSSERLRRELYFIWEVGGNSLRQRSRPERLRKCILAGEGASVALEAFRESLVKLVHNYSVQDFYSAYRAHPLYGQAFDDIISLPKLASDIWDIRADIEIAVEIFSAMPGLRRSPRGELALARQGTTDPIAQIVHIAGKSWKLLTGKEIQFAKGIERPPGASGRGAKGSKLRPFQDDVNFAYLCIRLVAGLDDPSTAITAVNRARKARTSYEAALSTGTESAKASKARVEFLARHDDEMRRTIYGLDY